MARTGRTQNSEHRTQNFPMLRIARSHSLGMLRLSVRESDLTQREIGDREFLSFQSFQIDYLAGVVNVDPDQIALGVEIQHDARHDFP
jgi:hypothetical protein